MSGVIIVFHQLFEVVRQSNYIEFNHSIQKVDTSGMYITVHDSPLVQRCNRRNKLAKNGKSVEQTHLRFAKLLPHANVFWSFTSQN